MQSSDPRALICRALLLDWLGQALVIGLLLVEREGGSFVQNVGQIEGFWPWMLFCFLLCSFGLCSPSLLIGYSLLSILLNLFSQFFELNLDIITYGCNLGTKF